MKDYKYVRFANREKEYYDLGADPMEINSKPGALGEATRNYWEQRLDDLHGCQGAACRAAENAPLSPSPAGTRVGGTP